MKDLISIKNNVLYIIVLAAFSIFCGKVKAASVVEIVSALNKNLEIESIFKELELSKGSVGLSKVQLICPSRRGNAPLFILGISWEGPKDGYILLLNETGNVLNKKHVGYIKYIESIDINDDCIEEIIIDSVHVVGTGYREDIFTIYSISDSELSVIWDQLSYKKSFPGPLSIEENYEIKTAIRFEDSIDNDFKNIIYYKEFNKFKVNSSGKLSNESIINNIITEMFVFEKGAYIKKEHETKEQCQTLNSE